MKKFFSVRTMAEIAVFAALGYVLEFLAGSYSHFVFVSGGSIGLALLCVFFVSYRRGPWEGIAVGLIIGLLDLADGFYSIADVWWKVVLQVILDYVISYPLAGCAGFFKPLADKAKDAKERVTWVAVGCIIGGLLKLASHYVSGIVFWPGDPWNVGGSYIYSLLYNGSYMLPDIIICGSIMIVIALKQPKLLTDPDNSRLAIRKNSSSHNDKGLEK